VGGTRNVVHLERSYYGADSWTLRKVDQKHLESFEMWCWRTMEKICWTDHGEMKKYDKKLRRRGITCKQYKERRPTGLVTSCGGTVFNSTLLEER
jgi:hypothetical protein